MREKETQKCREIDKMQRKREIERTFNGRHMACTLNFCQPGQVEVGYAFLGEGEYAYFNFSGG